MPDLPWRKAKPRQRYMAMISKRVCGQASGLMQQRPILTCRSTMISPG